jgi:hypothetical protein
MGTLIEEYSTEEQCSVVRFYVQNDSTQRVLIKKCFLFTLESACHVKWIEKFSQERSKIADNA